MVSGGSELVSSPSEARVTLGLAGVCATLGPEAARSNSGGGGHDGTGRASGCAGRLRRSGRTFTKRRGSSSASCGSRAASAMISAVDRVTAAAPAQGGVGVSTAETPWGPSTPATAGGPTCGVRPS